MSVAILPFLGAGGMALSAMAKAVQALYGILVEVNTSSAELPTDSCLCWPAAF